VDRRLVKYKFEPMDLANMRQNGIRSLEVMCQGCRHQVILNVDPYPGELRVRWVAHGLHEVRHGGRRRQAKLVGAAEVTCGEMLTIGEAK
jgi:hypothetical protein